MKKQKYANKIEFEGATYYGDGEADFSNRVFPGSYNDRDPDTGEYVAEFVERAVDASGGTVIITYRFDVSNESPLPEDLGELDWDGNIFSVKSV